VLILFSVGDIVTSVYPKSRESENESQEIDNIVQFLYGINSLDWLPEDSEVVENIEPKYSLFLLDNMNCLRLMKCAYFDDYAAALYREGEKYDLSQNGPERPNFNFCRRPEWLADSAALVLKKWSQFQGWNPRVIPLCILFDILAALGHCIDRGLFEEQAKVELSEYVHKFYRTASYVKGHVNECFGFDSSIWKDEIRGPILWRMEHIVFHEDEVFEKELLPLIDAWSIPIIQSLAGIQFYTQSHQLLNLPLFPNKVPDYTGLGLLTNVGRAKRVSDIHITELSADRHTRPYQHHKKLN
jgi:hypothetical protein